MQRQKFRQDFQAENAQNSLSPHLKPIQDIFRARAWIDINKEAKTATINYPVKEHNPRVVPITEEFLRRLSTLKRKSERVFPRDPCIRTSGSKGAEQHENSETQDY